MKWLIPIIFSTSALASTCDYDHEANETYLYQIQSVVDKDAVVQSFDNGASECSIRMSVVIDDKIYGAHGSYIYGPDVSQKTACERAELNAKENILKAISPVRFNSEKNMDCSLSSDKKERKIPECRRWRNIFIDGVKTRAWLRCDA